MKSRGPKSIRWLSPAGQVDSATEFQTMEHGILVDVGAASEVFIPWNRVLEYMGPRGYWQTHYEHE